MRLAHGAGKLDGGPAIRRGQLRPDEVHAGVGIGPTPPDRLFHTAADGAERVGAGDDHEVAVEPVPLVERGPILSDGLLAAHDRLARDVAATLREALILQVYAGDSGLHELLHRAHGG